MPYRQEAFEFIYISAAQRREHTLNLVHGHRLELSSEIKLNMLQEVAVADNHMDKRIIATAGHNHKKH